MQLKPVSLGHRCDLHLGKRPKTHSPDLMGSTCEPWITRCAIYALERILKPSMHGLEWSCGSGTLWYLQRLASLTSIEHNELFYLDCRTRVAQLDYPINQRWTGKFVPAIISESQIEQKQMKSIASYLDVHKGYENYVQQGLQLERREFDFIVIDGRSRSACLRLVIREGLLKAHDGILVLDNAERDRYQEAILEVPEHWPKFVFANAVDTTIIWLSKS